MKNKKVLVTGGAGYIGSHTILELIDAGFEVVSVDNYVNSNDSTYERIFEISGQRVPYYETDLRNFDETKQIFSEHPDFVGVIHFAALKSVPDSVANPLFALDNNNSSLHNIAKCCVDFEVPHLIFSSSCSVYGNVLPEDLPVTEETALKKAESPYAYTKQNGEVLLEFLTNVSNLHAICLRYFNPVGAHISGQIGELPSKRVNNLVPVITQAAAGIIPHFTVFGDDYNTRDGSCVRDYIHVTDIANAHVLALQKQIDGSYTDNYDIINLGSGDGVSVFEAIKAFEKASGVKAPYEIGPRRDGDVETIYSNPQKATEVLGWKPQYGIDAMMASAWKWQQRMKELGIAKHKMD